MTNKIIIISYLFPARNPGVTNLHFLEGKLRKEVFHKWSWSNRFSEHLRKHRPDYEIECWNCYSPKDYEDLGVYRKFDDGVMFIQFPVTEIGSRKIPFSLYKEFRKRVNSGERATLLKFTFVEGSLSSWEEEKITLSMATNEGSGSGSLMKYFSLLVNLIVLIKIF